MSCVKNALFHTTVYDGKRVCTITVSNMSSQDTWLLLFLFPWHSTWCNADNGKGLLGEHDESILTEFQSLILRHKS